MKTKLLEQLKTGKKIKFKHPEYGFTIHAELKMNGNEPAIKLEKINLPQKAKKGEKLLLKLVNIYCFDVLCNNLLNDVVESKEYKKLINGIK